MSLKIQPPTRMCVIAGSDTGKSFMIRRMIFKGDFGEKRGLEIIIYAPDDKTLKQPLWEGLKKFGYNVVANKITRKTPEPSPTRYKDRLIVFDDVDNAQVLPKWVYERFTIASHHLGESVVIISHKLKIGATEIRGSANWIILGSMSRDRLREVCKDLQIPEQRAIEWLSDPSGVVSQGEHMPVRVYNFIAVRQDMCLGLKNNRVVDESRYYKPCGLLNPNTFESLL